MPDVRMPDGTIIRNVPEGTTRAQLQARLDGQSPRAPARPSSDPLPAHMGGGQSRPQPRQPAPRSVGRTMADSVAALGGGLWRGMGGAVDMVADAGDALGSGADTVVASGLRALGADRVADHVQRSGNAQRSSRLRLAEIPDRLGTPRMATETGEFMANVLGGMVVPIGGKAPVRQPRFPVPRPPAPPATPAREIIDAGAREGVRVMRSDIRPPRTVMGRAARWVGEKIPFAGTGGMREAQQAQRIDAIKNVVTDFGGNAERTLLDDSGAAVDDVARNLSATRGGTLGKLTAQKEGVIANLSRGDDIVPVDRTVSAIDTQIAKLTRRGTAAAKTTADTLSDYRQAIQGKTLDQLEAIRKDELANAFKGGNTLADVKAVGEKSIRSIYDPLRADMGTFIRQRGGEDALAKWSGANEKLSAMAGELKSTRMKGVLRNEELTPEVVGNLLFSKNRSDVARLMGNLGKPGQAKAREAILQRAFDGSIGTDGLSAERFISNLDRLTPSITAAFKGPDLQRVQGLGRLLDATRRGATAGHMPTTGAQNTPLLILAGMMKVLGTTGTAVVGGGYGLLARAYESAPVRNELVRLASVKAGTRSEAIILDRAALAITNALRENISAAANSNVGVRAAAGNRPEDQREQQPAF